MNDEKNERIAELLGELSRLESDYADLEAEIADRPTHGEFDELKYEIESLSDALADAEADVEYFRDELDNLQDGMLDAPNLDGVIFTLKHTDGAFVRWDAALRRWEVDGKLV